MPYIRVLNKLLPVVVRCEGRTVHGAACNAPADWEVISSLGAHVRGTIHLALCDECFREALAKVRARQAWGKL